MSKEHELREFLHSVADRAVSFLESLDARPVGATASVDLLRSRLDRPLPGHSLPAAEAIDELVAGVEGGLVASAGPRYFGFVIGGATPASIAADWLTAAWDQNAQTYPTSPAAAVVEEAVSRSI